jgi:putative endonuclease
MTYQKSAGKTGEELVAQHLIDAGYRIAAYNYYQKCGEIDIIAHKGEVVAFVEVKLRTKLYFNSSEVVNFAKQKKIIATAERYIMASRLIDTVFRFDVALVCLSGATPEITYIENAFTKMSDY